MQTLDDLLMPEIEARLAETRKEIEGELAEWNALPEDVRRAQWEISESRWEALDKAFQEAELGDFDGEFNYCHNKLLDALDENFISKEL